MYKMIRFTKDELQYMALLETVTQVECRDCIIDSERNRIIFVVREGDAGRAIGRNGVNVKRLSGILGKPIEVVEYSDDPAKLIVNALMPARVKEVRIVERPDRRKMAVVVVDPKAKGAVIGRSGRNIDKARKLAKRYFDINHVIVREE